MAEAAGPVVPYEMATGRGAHPRWCRRLGDLTEQVELWPVDLVAMRTHVRSRVCQILGSQPGVRAKQLGLACARPASVFESPDPGFACAQCRDRHRQRHQLRRYPDRRHRDRVRRAAASRQRRSHQPIRQEARLHFSVWHRRLCGTWHWSPRAVTLSRRRSGIPRASISRGRDRLASYRYVPAIRRMWIAPC